MTNLRLSLIALILFFAIPATSALAQRLARNGKIAFVSNRDGNYEIYVMDSDGTNVLRLTNNSVVDDHPTWSPDGKQIAYVSGRPEGGFAIYRMDANGANKTEIIPINFNASLGELDAWSMSWSPDGSKIVFQENPDSLSSPNDLYIVNTNGSDRHVLVDDAADEREPAWSPDGTKILFSKSTSDFVQSLHTVEPDGTGLVPLINQADENDSAGTWSPLGDKIAFRIFDYANFPNIGVSNSDGSGRFWFDSGSVGPSYGSRDKPDWSPDGRKIVFQVSDDFGTQIYVKGIETDPDTTLPILLTERTVDNFKPSWQSLRRKGVVGDFDGDGRSDISVYRPWEGVWYTLRSQLGFEGIQWGLANDIVVRGDFDGDTKADPAIYRDGTWWVLKSDGGAAAFGWGLAGDVPVPEDYDGDRITDAAVFRSGTWWILKSTGGYDVFNWGLPGDKLVPGDYDGDARSDVAIFRDGTWWVLKTSGGYEVRDWGLSGDRPVPGDYDGDGRTDPAVYRDGVWWIQKSTGGYDSFQWGLPSDIPVPADYDGDGLTDPAIYRDGDWWILKSTGGYVIHNWGLANDIPIPAL